MATSYNDQWVLQRSAERKAIVRRISSYGAIAGTLEKRSHRVLRVPASSIRQSGVLSVSALLKTGRQRF